MSRTRSLVIAPSARACGAVSWLGIAMMLGFVANAYAAAPQLKYLYPPGAQRGQTATVTAKGTFDAAPLNVWVDLKGVDAHFVVGDDQKPNLSTTSRDLSVTVAPETPLGIAWIRLYDAQGATAPVPLIVGHVPEINEQEPNDLWHKPQELPADHHTLVNGRMSPSRDVDIFALHLDAGETVIASCTAHRKLASQVDLVLQVVSTDGIVLAQNDDYLGLDPRLAFTAPTADTYLVRTFGFPAKTNSSIALDGRDDYLYRLLITTRPFADYCWPMAVTKGIDSQVEIFGWNLSPQQRSIDIASPVDDRVPAELLSTLANVAPLGVITHPSILEVDANTKAQPQTIQLPTTITGRIDERGDEDAYQFAATAGRNYRFRLESRSMGFPLDAVLELFDSADKSLVRVDDTGGSRDAELVHAIPADGEYRLVVSDLHRRGGPRFVYRLHAEVAAPDFSLSVDSHQILVTSGKALEVVVNIARSYGLADDIEVSFAGLPEGAVAAPQTSVAKDDSSKQIKLTLTAAGTPFSGPIHIVGQSPSGQEIVRKASAPIANRTQRTQDLWLTVLKATDETAK